MPDYTRLRDDADSNFRHFLAPPFTPREVTDAQVVFPASIDDFIPSAHDIPDDFWDRNAWTDFADTWFAFGLGGESQFWLKEGIEGDVAFRHLRVIMGSFEPKHEHKIAATGFLASLWFYAIEDPQSGKTWGSIPTNEED